MSPSDALLPSGAAAVSRHVIRRFAGPMGALAVLIVVPIYFPLYLQTVATQALVFGVFAMSLDLLIGYGGMISLGHAAFLGIGAYVAALLMVQGGITSAWIGIPAAIGAAGIGAAIAAVIALRLKGVYFMLVTFALGELAFSVAQKWDLLTTGGAEGISGVIYPDLPPFNIAWTTLQFYFFVLVCLVLAYVVLRRIVNSPFGATLAAIRQNEERMSALGYNTWLYKFVTFVVAGMVAGGAGALFVYENGIIVPANLDVLISGTAVFMVILGGSRTLYGPVIGAVIVTFIQYYGGLYYPETSPLFLGVIFVVVVLFGRNGVAGIVRRSLAFASRRLARG